ncbi:MAG TPA: glycosyltransferase family 2 protein [Anaerolineae bacterium]|nr:glycosyltransferase family 2 protein [Anaerolineae bacterium]HOQ97863.1 glycosyltransferase family 2 protein [Anaerolineae bacterium]HPL26968.1 glycosyltransferase family 2 protein [Anaerolineae bacterium]
MPKVRSISAFFPAYNDGGTIASMAVSALLTLQELVDDYEVIIIDDGSSDYTGWVIDELARRYERLRVIHHGKNCGYGGALRTGFASAQKDWVFYTDGDAQYDPRELKHLVAALEREGAPVDAVNGYKISRNDPLARIIIGRLYHHIVRLAFGFRLRDVDCDFRLIRRAALDRVTLCSDSGSICLELVKKLQDARMRFIEVPVHHYHRAYGRSQFFNLPRLWRTALQLMDLWWRLVIKKEHLQAAPVVPQALPVRGAPGPAKGDGA